MRGVLILGLCAALAGCSNSGPSGVQQLRGALNAVRAQQAPPTDVRAVITPEFLAAQTRPLIFAELPQRGAQAGLLRTHTNGAVERWVAPDGIAVSFERGVVVATRGLGGDLLSTDLSQVIDALAGRRTRALRVMRYLDGEDQVVARAYICDYSRRSEPAETLAGRFPATRVEEDCASSDHRVVNVYWIDRSGRIRKSRQWIGPRIGPLLTERLVD